MRSLFSLIAVLALAIGLTQPVSAESPAAWPRNVDITAAYPGSFVGGAPRVAAPARNAWTDAFVPYADWKALPTAHDAGGQHQTPQAELDAQLRVYRYYWARRNAEIFRDGNEVVPVRIHERQNAKAFGSPVMSGDN